MSPRPAAPDRRELGQVIKRLEQLYSQLPALACLGLCEHSCGEHIGASTAERQRLLAVGVDLDAPMPEGACPALTRTFGAGRCSVHAIRPTICPVVGRNHLDALPARLCPRRGLADDASAKRWMITSLQIGGHGDHLDIPAVRQLLELALTDQMAAGLPSRFLSGDRTVPRQLYERTISHGPDSWERRSVPPSHP